MVDVAQRLTVLTDDDRRTLQAQLHRRDLPPRRRARLEMVKAADLGDDLAAIAAWSGRFPVTVCRWLDRYRDGGSAALTAAPRAGRPRRADAAYLALLEQTVESAPRALGLPFDVWTSSRLSA